MGNQTQLKLIKDHKTREVKQEQDTEDNSYQNKTGSNKVKVNTESNKSN